ncbi:MAG: hypothetical protein LBQ54_07630 [Planctomycetaceae bacterium]|nr:hypothetical protein [Planctomycetaceae bacterium]
MTEEIHTQNFERKIIETLDKPVSTSVDGSSITRRSLDDVIKASDFIDRKEAAKKPFSGIKVSTVIPPNVLGQ